MLKKISIIAAGVLALSGGIALAQNSPSGWMPNGPNAAPGGAGGAAPIGTVGSPTANAQDTLNGGTRSTPILSQANKNQSAAGMPRSRFNPPAPLPYGPHGIPPRQLANPPPPAMPTQHRTHP